MPTVSVIVPCYNHARFLPQRMDSIMAQSFQDLELILLDDASTDGSQEVLDSYRTDSRVSHAVYNTSNSGSPFAQWRRGIELAQGEWIWIAESDDWAEPTFLERAMAAAMAHPDAVIVASTPLYSYPDGSTWHAPANGHTRCTSGKDFACTRLVDANPLTNVSSLLLRHSALMQLDWAPMTKMRLCGDWLLYAMMCRLGSVVELNRVQTTFRQHADSTSARAEREGLTLTEGRTVLDYLRRTYHLNPHSYARAWGRHWAKLEKHHLYPTPLRRTLRRTFSHYPAIRLWHTLYGIKLAL